MQIRIFNIPVTDTWDALSEMNRFLSGHKALAADDGVPAYAVFTDEELANITRLPELTAKSMESIPGIGEKKVIRYGRPMIEAYNQTNATAQ